MLRGDEALGIGSCKKMSRADSSACGAESKCPTASNVQETKLLTSWLGLWKDLWKALMKRSHERQNSHHEMPYRAHQIEEPLLASTIPPLSQLSPWSRSIWRKCEMWKCLLQVRGDARRMKNPKCIKVYGFWSSSLPVSKIVIFLQIGKM